MANIADLLRAFVVGGADFGQRQQATQERKRLVGIEDEENQRAKTAAMLQQQVLQGQVDAQQRAATAPRPPVEGSPEYYDMLRQKEAITGAIQSGFDSRRHQERLAEIAAQNQGRATAGPQDVNWQMHTNPDGSVVQINPRTGQTRPVPGASALPGGTGAPGGRVTQAERQNAMLYQSGKQGYDTLERLLESGKGVPGWIGQQVGKVGMGAGNVLTSDEIRQMRQAALQLSDAWLRTTSGAAVPESEVERFAESFIPRAGDDPKTLAQKKESRRTIIEAMRQGAARALPDGGAAPRPSEITLPDDPDEAARLYPGRSGGPGPRR